MNAGYQYQQISILRIGQTRRPEQVIEAIWTRRESYSRMSCRGIFSVWPKKCYPVTALQALAVTWAVTGSIKAYNYRPLHLLSNQFTGTVGPVNRLDVTINN